jgi:hypothetical protein
MAALSLVSSVSSRAIARVTQPHTSSKVFAVWVRSSTVSSTLVRGGYVFAWTASVTRPDRCKHTPETATTWRWAGTVTWIGLVGLSAKPFSSAAVW